MRLDVSEGLSALTRRLKDPVLLEWEQSIAWCDLDKQRGHEALRVLSRELVSRALPLGAAVLGLGLWFLSRIPDAGAAPLRAGLIVAGSLLAALSLPYAALRLGLLRPTLGTSLRVRLRARGVQVAGARGVVRMVGWATFDAFAFGTWREFHVLKLRARAPWPLRRPRPARLALFEVPPTAVRPADVRAVLLDRGLQEEALGEPGP
jgi:hypothetical protein